MIANNIINLTQLRTTISSLLKDKKDFKISGKKLNVITSGRESTKIVERIANVYSEYEPKIINDHHLKIGDFDIIVKKLIDQLYTVPQNITNEHKFVNYINQAIKDNANEPLIINFTASNGVDRNFKIDQVIEASHTGSTDTRTGRKGDALLWTKMGQSIAISLKQDNASRWASPDKNLKDVAEKFYTYVLQHGLTTVLGSLNKKDVYNLNPPVGFKLNERIADSMIFGKDIQPHGAVIIKTWDASDFKLTYDIVSILNINCSYIYRRYSDLSEKHIPYFVLRNDASRKVDSKIIPPGIRFEVVYEGGGKRGVKIVNYHA